MHGAYNAKKVSEVRGVVFLTTVDKHNKNETDNKNGCTFVYVVMR
jgi:hypothetical protein